MSGNEMDDHAWAEGYAEGMGGGVSSDCPYPKGDHRNVEDIRALSWISGFIEGKAEREEAKRDGRPMRLPQANP